MGIAMVVIGFLGLITAIVWLLINLLTKRPKKIPGYLILITITVFIIGAAITPAPEYASDTEEEIEQELSEEINIETDQDNDVAIEEELVDVDESENETKDDSNAISERAPPEGKIEVHFIDVGQGDSILIKAPSKNILIDGGNRGNTALNYIRNQGIKALDIVIGTHPHADHIGGLINVMQAIPVGEAIDPAVAHTTQTFEDYLDVIDEQGIWFTEGIAGMTWELGGGAKIQLLHPTAPSQSQLNNSSIVAKLTYGEISFLFTGDAEREAESQILGRGYELQSTILKVGHHGSKTSTTEAFLNAVKPEAAIIMCGRGNSYGHPHQETLSRLSAANVEIYRTDLHENIIVITDGYTYSINKLPYSYKENQPPPGDDSVYDIKGEFVGSRNSDKYHYPECTHAKRILESNRVWFNSIQEAAVAGYVGCKGCNPPVANVVPPADPTPGLSSEQTTFVGSRNSDVYHYTTCGHANRIKPENRVYFNSAADAKSRGYRPCKTCTPPN